MLDATGSAKGLLNIFDPQAEVKIYYSLNELTEIGNVDRYELLSGLTFNLIAYPLNEVGFTITRLEYTYLSNGIPIPELSREINTNYYVPPNPYQDQVIPGPGENSPYVFKEILLIFQDVIDYHWRNYQKKSISLHLVASIQDSSLHTFTETIIDNLPVLEMAEDFWPPTNVTIPPRWNISSRDNHSVCRFGRGRLYDKKLPLDNEWGRRLRLVRRNFGLWNRRSGFQPYFL